jgi:hypothetical protein
MFVVVAVLIVIPKHTPIVTLVQLMIDIRQVVPGYAPVIIYPHFPAKLTVSAFV